MTKKHPSPVRQASIVHHQSWQDDHDLNEEVVDDIIDDVDEDGEHYTTLPDQNHYSTLRKNSTTPGTNRYQRNPRSAQMSHFSQFSRLPPGKVSNVYFQTFTPTIFLSLVPERPSLENRELSPVPDIVSPTSPMLTQSYHQNQNNYSEPRSVTRRESRQGRLGREECKEGCQTILIISRIPVKNKK